MPVLLAGVSALCILDVSDDTCCGVASACSDQSIFSGEKVAIKMRL